LLSQNLNNPSVGFEEEPEIDLRDSMTDELTNDGGTTF
jgi:hypothetical protein